MYTMTVMQPYSAAQPHIGHMGEYYLPPPPPPWEKTLRNIIVHFTVVGLVTWPLGLELPFNSCIDTKQTAFDMKLILLSW